MKNYEGKTIETMAGKFRVIANNEEYLAAESLDDGMVTFFGCDEKGIAVNHCISFSVTKKRYFEVLDEAASKDENALDKALWNRFYRMPKILRELIIKAYISNSYLPPAVCL